jgi:hypothetical protein
MNFENEGVPTSAKRILGAALFGLLLSALLVFSANDTIPRLMVLSSGSDLTTARSQFETMGLLRLGSFIIAVATGAFFAGFLSRGKGIIAGLFANSLNIGLFWFIMYGEFSGSRLVDAPFGIFAPKVELIVVVCLAALVAAIAGHAGAQAYTSEADLDQQQGPATMFGIRWWHYFWIFPVVYFAFVESLIIVAYAWVNVMWKDTSYAWHPSLWFSLSAWFFLVLGFALAYAATLVAFGGLVRFHQTMEHGSEFHGWGKIGKILLYGVGAPALSYPLAALASDAAHAMPTPARGDWKLAVGLTGVFFVIGIIGSVAPWLRRRLGRDSTESKSTAER